MNGKIGFIIGSVIFSSLVQAKPLSELTIEFEQYCANNQQTCFNYVRERLIQEYNADPQTLGQLAASITQDIQNQCAKDPSMCGGNSQIPLWQAPDYTATPDGSYGDIGQIARDLTAKINAYCQSKPQECGQGFIAPGLPDNMPPQSKN